MQVCMYVCNYYPIDSFVIVCLSLIYQHAFAISFVLLILLTTHGCYCAAVRVVNSLPAEWKLWKEKHNKSYTGWHEELKSHVIWTANQAFIDAHNSYKEFFGFTLGMNSFGDLVYMQCEQ